MMTRSRTSENPFTPMPLKPETDIARQMPKVHTDVNEHGEIVRVKYESGVPVVVENLGTAREYVKRVVEKAALMRPGENYEESELSHVELASIRLAHRASRGDLDATKELLDRILGKSKQFSENTNINATLDEVLKRMDGEG